jgi:glycosyltransferase involved in cell wall biosynthesis
MRGSENHARHKLAPVSVLFVSSTANQVGGGQVSLLELLGVLDRGRYAPIAVVSSAGEMATALTDLGVPTRLVEMPKLRPWSVAKAIGSMLRIARLARTEGIELIHSNDPRAHLYAGPAAWWAGIPSVFHYRVSYSDGLYDRLVPRLCSKLVAVSHSVADRFPGFAGKVEVIENGVDIERFHAGAEGGRWAPRRGGCKPLLGTIGRLEKAKGIHTFIECVALLKQDHPEIVAVIVGKDERGNGEGEEDWKGKELIDLCARLQVADNVVFQDTSDDIPSLLAALDVYVLLSDNEGLNRTIIEAMSCATPVVATEVGGNPEIIDGPAVGRLVPYDDPAAAAAAIGELVGNPELRSEMGKRARCRIAARFSLARHKERMEALFTSLARR